VSHGFDFKRSETFRQNHHSSPAKMKYKKEPVKKNTEHTKYKARKYEKKKKKNINRQVACQLWVYPCPFSDG
jgi:hypothetical protein